MREFETYLTKEKLQLPQDPYFTRQKVLLILSGHGYKPEKTYEAIVAMLQWRKANLPPQLTTKAEEILVPSGDISAIGLSVRLWEGLSHATDPRQQFQGAGPQRH